MSYKFINTTKSDVTGKFLQIGYKSGLSSLLCYLMYFIIITYYFKYIIVLVIVQLNALYNYVNLSFKSKCVKQINPVLTVGLTQKHTHELGD